MKIAVVGLGLIGGSLAKAIKQNTTHTVIGLDKSTQVLAFAQSVNAIDTIGTVESLGEADITFVCLYPSAVVEFIVANRNRFKKKSIVTDTAGVKSCICDVLYQEELPFAFIGGHPMAGREVSGFENSLPDLFKDANYLLTPKAGQEESVKQLESLILSLGFRGKVCTSPQEHDAMIAYTSQTPHVLACAYVQSPKVVAHATFGAGSFRDVSRVAKINEELWAQLFLDNKKALVSEIDTLLANLTHMKTLIKTNQYEELKATLRHGREIKEALDK